MPLDSSAWDKPLGESSGRGKIYALVALFALVVISITGWKWYDSAEKNIPSPPPLESTTEATDQPWQLEAEKVLGGFLSAGSSEKKLSYVTRTKETDFLLPKLSSLSLPSGELRAEDFAARSMPQNFSNRGIYMMYYERPDSAPRDALFQPIVPMRVDLLLDSPGFLESSAGNRDIRKKNDLRVCAFFRRHPDGKFTLDWPVFVQTRYNLLKRFSEKPQASQTFRLLIKSLPHVVQQHVYRKKLPGHDWYRIHCPAYPNQSYTIAVPEKSPQARLLVEKFSENPAVTRAITGELSWLVSDEKDHHLVLTKLHCFEFFGLNNN